MALQSRGGGAARQLRDERLEDHVRRGDYPQVSREAGDGGRVARAQHGRGEDGEGDEPADPHHRREHVQEEEPLVERREQRHGRAPSAALPAAPARARSARGSRSAGTSAAATRTTATQNVCANASARAAAPPPSVSIERWRTTASSAVPSDPASRWITLIALVACATASRGTAAKATAIDGMIVPPSPSPITNSAAASERYGV